MRGAAEAALDGQVNDWVAAAKENARNVVALLDEMESQREAHTAAVAALAAEVESHRWRREAAEAALSEARTTADRVGAENVRLARDLSVVRIAGENLNARIVETRGDTNTFVFMRDSRGVIETFRKAVGV